MRKLNKYTAAAALALISGSAMAGATAASGNTDFASVQALIYDWMDGDLGKAIAAAFILIGVTAGVARQNLMAFAVGLTGGVGLLYAGDILDALWGASVPVL